MRNRHFLKHQVENNPTNNPMSNEIIQFSKNRPMNSNGVYHSNDLPVSYSIVTA